MTISTAIDANAVARGVGIKTNFTDLRSGAVRLLPQRIALIGMGRMANDYSTDKRLVTSAGEVGELYGYGTQLHLAALQLFPRNGDGVGTVPVTVYPIGIDDDDGTQAIGSVTVSGLPTANTQHQIRIGGQVSSVFELTAADNLAAMLGKITQAINSNINMPVTLVNTGLLIDLSVKWTEAVEHDRDIAIDVINLGEASAATFAITNIVGGTHSTLETQLIFALDRMGGDWETMVVNCLAPDVTAIQDRYSSFNEGRWGALVRKPLVVISGTNRDELFDVTAYTSTRVLDRTGCVVHAPSSPEMGLTLAARAVSRAAVLANNNPPHDYGGQRLTGLVPGPDSRQLDYVERNAAVLAGVSTTEVREGVITLSDMVTHYNPVSEPDAPYRFVVDVVKLQNIIYNLGLIFDAAEWEGAPLIPDNQPSSNRAAKKPKMAVAEIAAMLDSLGNEAIISDPASAKAATQVVISTSNPKRLDVNITVALSGNANVISADLNFGFLVGVPTVV